MMSWKYLPPLALVTLSGCATFQAGAPEGMIDVIAHRGASAHAPENTLAAFEKAAEAGADWFELDCHLTHDGELAVMHDGNLKRTTGLDRHVRAMTLAEVRQLDAGSWFGPEFAGERIPTLGEALDLARGRIGVYIEIKSDTEEGPLYERMMGIAKGFTGGQKQLLRALMAEIGKSRSPNLELTRKTIAEVKKRRMGKQVVLQSFSPVVCVIAMAEAPALRTEFLGGYDKDKPEGWDRYMAFAEALRPAGLNINFAALNGENIARIRKLNASCAVWTVDEPAQMKTCAELGVDAVISNKPELCRSTLREAGRR